MITIGQVTCRTEEGKAILEASVQIPREAQERWVAFSQECANYGDYSYITSDYGAFLPETLSYAVDAQWAELLCKDRADAFVTALIYYALATGEDIRCESPLSSDLLFGLNQMLIPLLSHVDGFTPIAVKASEAATPSTVGRFVGTGMSMGVDSFHTLCEYTRSEVPEDYRLTHLTYFTVGADLWRLKAGQGHAQIKKCLREYEQIRRQRIETARGIAAEAGLSFVSVESNIGCFYEGAFEETHIFRTCSAAMALSEGIGKYYFSSTGLHHQDYNVRLRIDPAHYEQFLLPCLSTAKQRIINGGKPCTRIEKLETISGFPIAQQHMITCDQDTPCYRCTKDYRTIIAIALLGKEREFAACFDPQKSLEALPRAYGWVIANRKINVAARTMWEEIVKRKPKIPASAYIYAGVNALRRFYRRIFK